jgi:hypothetical protein
MAVRRTLATKLCLYLKRPADFDQRVLRKLMDQSVTRTRANDGC